jgi:hypothetical protein
VRLSGGHFPPAEFEESSLEDQSGRGRPAGATLRDALPGAAARGQAPQAVDVHEIDLADVLQASADDSFQARR